MTDPKPNIRPGVRGIRRDGFWSPPIEASDDPLFQWKAGGMTWTAEGNYFGDSCVSPCDIISIVEDLPPVPSQKPAPSNAPIYAVIYPGLATIARQHGYALAVHGSMQRDFDLVAVPWTEHPSEPDVVVKEFTTEFDLRVVGDIGHKLHHRTVYSISLSGNCAIDLSFMPTVPSPQQKSYWRLLELGEVIQEGDEFWDYRLGKFAPTSVTIGMVPESAVYRRRVHAPEPQPAPQIPGMPEGWEVDPDNEGFQNTYNCYVQIPIRRIKPPEPVCTWQHGVFKDGWLSQDANNGVMQWTETEPMGYSGVWTIKEGYEVIHINMMLNPPKFRDDLPWDQRCVRVGPEAEKGMGQ